MRAQFENERAVVSSASADFELGLNFEKIDCAG
jgi:hypothetical protein